LINYINYNTKYSNVKFLAVFKGFLLNLAGDMIALEVI